MNDGCRDKHFQFRLRRWHEQSLPIYSFQWGLTRAAALVSSSSHLFLDFTRLRTLPFSPRQAPSWAFWVHTKPGNRIIS